MQTFSLWAYLDTISKNTNLKAKVQRDFKWFKKSAEDENRHASKEQGQSKHEAEHGHDGGSAQDAEFHKYEVSS